MGKKSCVLRLFNQDVQAANEVIRSSEEKLRVLQLELEKNRSAACTQSASYGTEDTFELSITPRGAVESNEAAQADMAATKLRAAIAGAVAALEMLEGGANQR